MHGGVGDEPAGRIRGGTRRKGTVVVVALYASVCGWLLLPQGPARRRWLGIGVFAAALSVAFLPWHVRMLEDLGHRIHRDGKLYAT